MKKIPKCGVGNEDQCNRFKTCYMSVFLSGCLLIVGCASSQLGVDPDYRWVGGRTYTANIKKLQAYSKCELPKCDASNHGEFTVVDPNIEDLGRPLKMVVDSGGVKYGTGIDWELYLYHVVSNAEKGVEVVTTVCKSDYGRFEPILRKEVVKYVRESQAEECKEWRSWAVCTNYNELTKQSPCITFGPEFYDMIREDVLDQIYDDTRRFCGFGDISQILTEHILGLQKLGLMEISVNPKMSASLTDDQVYANRVREALNNPFSQLRVLAFTALMGAKAGPLSFDIVRELSAKVSARKIALKKKLDEEAELARLERERLAFEKRVAEEKRKREEAEVLKRKQAEDKILLDQLDESISGWRRDKAKEISEIVNSDNPISSLVAFLKEGGIPVLKVPSQLQLAESREKAEEKLLYWNRWREISVKDFTSTDSGVRAKAIYELRPYCNCLDEMIWEAIEKHCAAEEGKVFDKSFYKKEIPVGGKAVDLALSYAGFGRPSHFKLGARYSLIHAKNAVGYRGFKGAELGSCFDRSSGAYNVFLNTGIYMDSNDHENIIVSGIGDDRVTGSSLPVDTEVIYRGTVEGRNGFGNVVRLRHFEVFDEGKLNLAEVSAFEIGNGCKGVEIDGQRFFFLFAKGVQDAHRIGGHFVGDIYIFRKNHKIDENTDMKQVLVREGNVVVGMFGVRLGAEVESLSVANIGKLIGDPVVLPGSNGGVDMLRYRYDYPGNRGVWDVFSFDIRNQNDNHKVLRVEVSKSYENEQAALSGASDFRDYILAKYGVSLVNNPLAQNGRVWLQMFEQSQDTVLMAVKVYEKDGKYRLTYSLLGLPKIEANQE